MKIDLQSYVIPTHFVCAIVNDDYSGLDDNEHLIIIQFIKDLGEKYIFTAPCDGEEYFTRCHDLREYGVLACDCIEVEIAFKVDSEPDYDADDAVCNRYNSAVCAMLLS
jgi:hypothetical protein